MGTPPVLASDYERMATVFDRYLPLIAPVGTAIVDKILPFAEGARVLDVACGTGEPGLSLLRRMPSAELSGIDGVQAMIEIARHKASAEGLVNARFETMQAERIERPDASFDVVVSRFGLLMFGDAAASAREMRRVLRPGGAYALAVWDEAASNTLVSATLRVLRPLVPADLVAPFETMQGATAGARLVEAGFADVVSERVRWSYELPSEEALWELVSGPGIFARHFAGLDEAKKARARDEILEGFARHRTGDGRYVIPHACALLSGRG
jgi:ubiquinone/menaquinone biosynthesis C-methylase UbiE